MAVNKRLISSKFPYITIHIAIGQNSRKLGALLDTGFDGYAALPAGLVTNGQPPEWFVTCKLADNSEIHVPAYTGSIRIGLKKLKDITVIIMGDEPLVGRSLTNHFTVILDHGRRIIIEP